MSGRVSTDEWADEGMETQSGERKRLADGGGGEGCLAGDPGGVVLTSLTFCFAFSAGSGDAGGDGEVN